MEEDLFDVCVYCWVVEECCVVECDDYWLRVDDWYCVVWVMEYFCV